MISRSRAVRCTRSGAAPEWMEGGSGGVTVAPGWLLPCERNCSTSFIVIDSAMTGSPRLALRMAATSVSASTFFVR